MQEGNLTDILIIGGGIAGCIAAISLVKNHRVTLIDKLPEPKERIGESLAPAAQRILKKLNLLEGIKREDIAPVYIKNIGMQSYWGSDQVHIVDHMRNPDGLGMNLDRKAFEMYLRQVAEARGVECVWPAHLFSCELHDDRWHCTAKSEDANYSFTSKFVIDATGRSSYFSSKLGIKRKRYDKLISYWAYMSDQEENQMSTISAGRNGWWYTAVIPNKRRVIAYQTDSDLVDRAKIKSLGAFLSLARDNNKITRILERSNGDICFHGAVAANSSRLDKASGNQWAAIGDAAISFDPLSSQGMFHAMASAMQLKELITKHDIISNCNSNYMDNFKKEYNDQIDKIWEHYIQHKDLFYRQERRWMNSTFWKRRHLLLVEEI